MPGVAVPSLLRGDDRTIGQSQPRLPATYGDNCRVGNQSGSDPPSITQGQIAPHEANAVSTSLVQAHIGIRINLNLAILSPGSVAKARGGAESRTGRYARSTSR